MKGGGAHRWSFSSAVTGQPTGCDLLQLAPLPLVRALSSNVLRLRLQARILSYLRQLAIITPYAEFSLSYTYQNKPRRAFSVEYARRSTKMPPQATEVKHHPKSVNNLLVKQIMDRNPTWAVEKCLHTEFAAVSKALAKRLVGTPCIPPPLDFCLRKT